MNDIIPFKYKVLGVLLFLVLSKGSIPAQTSESGMEPSVKPVTFKNRAPVNPEMIKVTLPPFQEMTLENGFRVLVIEQHKVPMFTMELVLNSGGLSDPPDHRGLASFTAALLREGTINRTSKQIAEQLEALGTTFSAKASPGSTTTNISINGLIKNLDKVLDLFADLVLRPTFPKEELERFKARIASQRQAQRASTGFLVEEQFNHVIYKDHPASLIRAPIEVLQRTTPEQLARFHREHYRPNNATLVIIGDVTFKQVRPKVEQAFGSWARGSIPETRVPDVPAPEPTRIHFIDRPGSVQTVFYLGSLAIERTDSDYFPLLVMNGVLGQLPNSRLFLNLRSTKGYAYSTFSTFEGLKYRGTWAAASFVRPEVTDAALHEMLYELERMVNSKVPVSELDGVKRTLIGLFALSLQDPQICLKSIITQMQYNLPDDYWTKYPENINRVTAEDIQRVARKYLDLKYLQIVVVGDASKIKPMLTKYRPVEVYDTEGRRVSTEKY